MDSSNAPAGSLLSPTSSSAASQGATGYATRQTPTSASSPSPSSSSPSSTATPSLPVAVGSGSGAGAGAGTGHQGSLSPRRRARLQRSERLQSESSQSSQSPSYSSWEALIRDSFGQIVWPIRITSWELVQHDSAGGAATAGSGSTFLAGARNASYNASDYVTAR